MPISGLCEIWFAMLRIVEDDAFLAVSAKFKDVDSDEEKEDIAIIASISKQIEAKAREGPKFRKSFVPLDAADEDVKPAIKTEVLSDDEHPSTSQVNPQDGSGTASSSQKKENGASHSSRNRHDSDNSPARKPRYSDSDQSPARKRHDSDSDQSPVRKRHDSDQSPPRQSRLLLITNRSTLQEPEQFQAVHHILRDVVPMINHHLEIPPSSVFLKFTERSRRHDLESDESPPRKRGHRYSDKESSSSGRHTRKKRYDSDESPPRARDYHGKRMKDSDSDQSPPRRSDREKSSGKPHIKTEVDSDQSPPRKGMCSNGMMLYSSRDAEVILHRISLHQENIIGARHRLPNTSVEEETIAASSLLLRLQRNESPPRNRDRRTVRERRIASPEKLGKETQRTLDGKVAGLQSADALKEESEKIRQREAEMFEEMDASISGRYAETRVREKQVRKKREKPEDKERKEREAKKQAELKVKYDLWNKGVAQLEQREQQLEEMARVAAEPLARMADDETMNRHLKELIHEEDPMAEMLLSKKREKAIDQGELVYPTYQGECPPNRFGIRPGYRWDGVDRSNGFEAMLAQSKNRRNAQEKEYYQNLQLYE
ncbi:hypothetical protein OESDEN_04664 [Oesophagostomum dentatum]|uniref:BUD13 homolog n=1 Tax=Oesophagostomum dentatum TaxID=61180 RepID=A0A0B1TIZ9_OESDE|nr:hypothetical protein OESDEN_04664 [Oesophagostomum dentatum]